MKDPTLFALFTGGGFGVIVSYIFLYLQGSLQELMTYYTKLEWRFWLISMLFTVVSVIGLIVWFSFYENLEKDWNTVFITSLAVFLAFAMLWSVTIAYIYKNRVNPSIQQSVLLIVGLATVGLLLATIGSNSNWLVITAAAIVVWHHLIVDGFWWPTLHQRGYNNRLVNYKGQTKKGRSV